MRELIILVLVVPLALLTVFTNRMATVATQSPQPTLTPVTFYLTPVATPAPTLGIAPVGIGPTGVRAQAAINEAMTWVGVRYLWGGCSHQGIDCSCLVQHVDGVAGISVPRTTVQQIAFDTPVPRADLRPGDTVFFNDTCTGCGANPTHEGLYLGNGKMIDAGDPVQVDDVFTGFYGTRYAGAGRPPGF